MSAKRDVNDEAPDVPAGGPDNSEPATRTVRLDDIDAGVPVMELLDVTADAARLGFRCPIALFPEVLEQCELAAVLLGLRTALVGAAADPETARMFGVAFGVVPEPDAPEPLLLVDHKRPGELARTIQTLYGGMVVFQVTGSEGTVHVVCRPWSRGRMLVLQRRGDPARSILGEGAALTLALTPFRR